ncbi:MAG: hypothetical protein ACM3US_02605 [Sphingomonadaceae bacterium]
MNDCQPAELGSDLGGRDGRPVQVSPDDGNQLPQEEVEDQQYGESKQQDDAFRGQDRSP